METTHIYNAGKGEAACLMVDKDFEYYKNRSVSRVMFTGDPGQEYKVFTDLLKERN